MATAPVAPNKTTVSDRYAIDAASGVFTAATPTAGAKVAWTFGTGPVTINSDEYYSSSTSPNTAPDTLAIKYTAPSNFITNQWGGLADMQSAYFPSIQPIVLKWTGTITNKYALTGPADSGTSYYLIPTQSTYQTQEDLKLAAMDYRPGTSTALTPGTVTFLGFDKNADRVVIENYLGSSATPYESETLGLSTGLADVVQTSLPVEGPIPKTTAKVAAGTILPTQSQTITQSGNYQWVFAASLQPNSNLTTVNNYDTDILSASVYQLSNSGLVQDYQAGQPAASPVYDSFASWDEGINKFRDDLRAQVNNLLPGGGKTLANGEVSSPQKIPNPKWDDLEIQINFDENAFKNSSWASPLKLDGAYRLQGGSYDLNNSQPATNDATIGTSYMLFLDPNAKYSQSIAIDNFGSQTTPLNYKPTNQQNDVVSYSQWGVNKEGTFDIVEAGTGALTDKSFTSSSQGAVLTFSNSRTEVVRPGQGDASASVSDYFTGIEGFFLTTGKDSINIDTTLTSTLTNGNFNAQLSQDINSGDVGQSYFVMGGLGVDSYKIITSGEQPSLNLPKNDVSHIKTLGILLSDGARENSGVVYNLGINPIAYRAFNIDAETQTEFQFDGSAKFQLKDGYGNVENLTFERNSYVENIVTQGTAFRDIYAVTDNGGRGHYSNLYVQASRGNDSVIQDQDYVWDTGGSSVDFKNDNGSLKAVGITLDYSNLADYIPLKDQVEGQARVDSGLYAYTNTIWKAGYGMDNYEASRSASYNNVTLEFSEESDYAEFDAPRVNTDDLKLNMGSGSDLVYLNLPWIANSGALSTRTEAFDGATNKQIDVQLGWNDGNSDSFADHLQIDLTNIEDHVKTLQVNEINIEGFNFYQDTLSFVTQNVRLDDSVNTQFAGPGLTSAASNDQIFFSQTGDNTLVISYKDDEGVEAKAITVNFVNKLQDAGQGPQFSNSGNLNNSNPFSLQFLAERSVAQYAPVYMTDNADSAILNEDSGYAGPGLGIYDFKGGNDLVTLYKGDLDVALGAGDDTARVYGTSGNSVIIGGAGDDKISVSGNQNEWSFSVLTTTQAAQMLADKYGKPTVINATTKLAEPPPNLFGIEQDAAGLNVVILANKSLEGEYAVFDQTLMFQAESVAFDDGTQNSETLLGSMNYTLDLIGKVSDKTVSQNFFGRRATDADSITISTDTTGVMSGLKNIRSLIDTGVDVTSAKKDATAAGISTKLAGTVLDGSSINKLDLKQIASSNTAVDYFVDIEKIVLTDGTAANTFTIRLAGSNGYDSVDDAVNDSNFGDIIYVADTIESVLSNNKGSQSVNTQSSASIKSGLGIAFEAMAPNSGVFNVTVSEEQANSLLMGDEANIPGFALGDGSSLGQVGISQDTRVTFLLGDNDVNVQGSGLNDLIIGNRGANVIRGGGGDDVLFGGAGSDVLMGQTGDDTLIGSDSDYLNAGSGNDVLYAGGTTRTTTGTGATAVTKFDTQVAIAGSGNDQVVLLKNSGQVNAFLGSGSDELIVSDDWFSSFANNKTGTGTSTSYSKPTANDPIAKILDFSTTTDSLSSFNYADKETDPGIESDLGKVGITIQQLVSPPNPVEGAHEYLSAANNSTIENIDFSSTGSATASVAELINAYKLVNG